MLRQTGKKRLNNVIPIDDLLYFMPMTVSYSALIKNHIGISPFV